MGGPIRRWTCPASGSLATLSGARSRGEVTNGRGRRHSLAPAPHHPAPPAAASRDGPHLGSPPSTGSTACDSTRGWPCPTSRNSHTRRQRWSWFLAVTESPSRSLRGRSGTR